jgi:glycosyltransferase involved in cell wall biosynthesis
MNVLRLLRWLRQRGWDTIAYAHPESEIYRHAVADGQPVRLVRSDFKYGDLLNAARLARKVRRDKVRVVILNQSPDMFLGVLAKHIGLHSFKLVYSQHMMTGSDKLDWFHRWEYRHFDAWVTPAHWLSEQVQRKTVVPQSKIHVIPYGIELDRFTRQRLDKKDARRRLGLPATSPLAGIIGRLDKGKRQDTVVRALARVRQAGHDLHLAIVGAKTRGEETGYAESVYRLVDDLGLSPYVHFLPHQSEPQHAYAALDVFVLASEGETYGMVVIEALASGLPVIASASGGPVEQISPGQNGLLFTPLDDEALAAGLLRYLTDPEFARRMAVQGAQDAARRYAHTQQCEAWEKVLWQLVPATQRT